MLLLLCSVIQTWGTLVVTGKDDNVSGSACEIRGLCVVGYLRVYRLTKNSPYFSMPDSLDTALSIDAESRRTGKYDSYWVYRHAKWYIGYILQCHNWHNKLETSNG